MVSFDSSFVTLGLHLWKDPFVLHFLQRSAKQSVRAASEIPGAKLVVIPNCGHVPQEEKPQEFLSAVEEFLADLIQ